MTHGERIKEHRTRLGYSQEKIAELVGTSRQAVTKWETGKSIPCMENLTALAEIFGISLAELSNGISEKSGNDTTEDGERARSKKRLLIPDIVFVLAVVFAVWNIIKIPAIIGYSITGFLSIVMQAATILYIPLYLLWIRPRRNNKASDKKEEPKNSMLRKALWLVTAIAVLFVSFLLCRFTFLDLHGSYQYPVFLLLAGIAAAIIAAIFDGYKVMICTVIGYIGGFAFGIMLGVDGIDQGGGATNNWWVLWTVSFIALIIAGVIWELLSRRTARRAAKRMVGV